MDSEASETTPLNNDRHRRRRRSTRITCAPSPETGVLKSIGFRIRRNLGSRDFWRRKCPIIDWLPNYNRTWAIGDLIAGLTVGLTVIPQAIAYATLAGLSPQYGLYSAFVGCFVYAVFGSTKMITIGPTAIMALMTQKYVSDHGAEFAFILCFTTGVIVLVFGLLNLGFLVNFISAPVTLGFTSAAAITIIVSQIKSLLGLHSIHSSADDLIGSLKEIAAELPNTKGYDFLMGEVAIILLVLLKLLSRVRWKDDEETTHCSSALVVQKLCWFLCTARNFLVVVLCGLVGTWANWYFQEDVISMSQAVPRGVPSPKPPPFSIPGNETTPGENFGDILATAGSSVIVIPLIAILESIAIAKSFSFGRPVDATQEMIALGFCNILGSFFQSMPTTGSFSRTAINYASGVCTPFGGIYTGILVMLALVILTPLVPHIPRTALAAVIVTALVHMVDFKGAAHILRSRKIDFVPFMATFISCLLLGLEYGILIGIGCDILILLFYSARPELSVSIEEVSDCRFILVLPDRGLFFPSHEKIRDEILTTSAQLGGTPVTFVFDLSNTHDIDYSVVKTLDSIIKDLQTGGNRVAFASVCLRIKRALDTALSEETVRSVCFYLSLEHYIEENSNQGTIPPLQRV